MNDDYLWDKTGEPDPEIERLERVLGRLRYQPRTFELPAESQNPKRTWIPLLAIAAGLAIAVVAAGLWLAVNRPMTGEIAMVEIPAGEPPLVRGPAPAPTPGEEGVLIVPGKYRRSRVHRSELTARLAAERKEAEQAKQQLLLALRLTSSKLSMAQKKVQGTPGTIRNQHKLG